MKTATRFKIWTVLLCVSFIVGLVAGVLLSGGARVPTAVNNAVDEVLKKDWAHLGRYREANEKLGPPAAAPQRVVFFGDSITEGWLGAAPEFFAGKPYIDRGIGGQTTQQMLVRFRQDVVTLNPAIVVILGGINDLGGKTGASTPQLIEDNLGSMVEIARANKIQPVLCSLLPYARNSREIDAINRWIADYARANGLVTIDYYSKLVDDKAGLPANLSSDGLHPNRAGYEIMAPLAEAAIAKVEASAGTDGKPTPPDAAPAPDAGPASGGGAASDAAGPDKGR